MSIWRKISAQFGRPTGLFGTIAGTIMAKRASNLERNVWAISLLKLRPTDRVLEIGFGPGIAIQKMSEVVTEGIIWGIDHSEVMFKQASKRNREALSKGRVKLLLGSVSTLSSLDGQVDKILDINSLQFWESPVDDLKKLRTYLAPGGIVALVHQPRKPGSTVEETDRAGRKYADYLERAGFRDISIEKRAMKPVSTVCALGRG
jgi:ubiquinone/menaquinone biosynthesis C-methylase UbiE